MGKQQVRAHQRWRSSTLSNARDLLADDASTDGGSNHRARRRPLAVQPSLSAGLNNYFLIVCHHDDLAAKVIRQRMRKIVYHVSFVPQIG